MTSPQNPTRALPTVSTVYLLRTFSSNNGLENQIRTVWPGCCCSLGPSVSLFLLCSPRALPQLGASHSETLVFSFQPQEERVQGYDSPSGSCESAFLKSLPCNFYLFHQLGLGCLAIQSEEFQLSSLTFCSKPRCAREEDVGGGGGRHRACHESAWTGILATSSPPASCQALLFVPQCPKGWP